MIYRVILFAAASVFSSVATAQVVTPLTDPTYLAVVSTANLSGVCAQPYCVSPQQGIPLSYFATSAQLSSITTSAQLNSINSQISKALEIGAISAAMGDAIPNPGDRFAFRINAAGFNGEAGGALGLSYNFTNNARLSINYGQGRSQSVVSGGLNLSFH
jgi:hypothetical protein